MKYPFTKIEDSAKPFLETAKSLLKDGVDLSGEFMTVKDALDMPNSGLLFNRAIEELILAPAQPTLIGERLIKVTHVTGAQSRSISIRTLGALDMFDFLVPEEGEYREISQSMSGGTIMEIKFAKYGCKFKISEELLLYSTWDLITYQIQQIVDAMARYRDKRIFEMLENRGIVVFDNESPTTALIGRTGGRDINGVGNGSMTYEDFIDMYAAISMNGYTPKIILINPLHWSMFAKDPILREMGLARGSLDQWFRSAMNPARPYDNLGSLGGRPGSIVGTRRELSDEEAEIANQTQIQLDRAPNPISNLTVITSHMVPFDTTKRTGNIIMLDPDNTGILAIQEPLSIDSWDEPRNDLRVIKFKERWGMDVIDEGKAIAVAYNVSAEPNELYINPQVTIDAPAPIVRKP